MTPLRQKMIDAMQVRGFSVRTHKSYLSAVTDLARYTKRSPDTLTVDDLQPFFLYLVKERGLSGATCRLYLNAIRFLYLQVLAWKAFDVQIPIPKKAQRIPELLTVAEVGQILSACRNRKHKMMLMLCYGCGLRVSEVVSVWVRHIDGERHLLRIEQAKGAKDRSVILSDQVLYALRDYWRLYRPAHWLFSGEQPDRPLSISSLQTAFQAAKQRADVHKVGGIHSLRHAYATHQLVAGMPIHVLQQQLGHQDLRTTTAYLHWIPNYREGQQGADLIAALAHTHD